MVSRVRILLVVAVQLAAAVLLAGCGEEPRGGGEACTPPAGTVPFEFESGGRELVGFIDAPRSDGPHPAVLLVPDAGRTDVMRGDGAFAELRAAFRSAGIASIVWDRAGSGCSGGRYRGLADLYLRADEVVAALDALDASERIDAGRIGAWALGEGVWVASMAAARGHALQFLILVGGPAGDPIDRLVHFAEHRLRAEGYRDDEAEALAERLRAALKMMREQAPFRRYRAAVEPLSRHPILPPMSAAGGDVYADERRYDELRESAALHVTIDVFLAAIEAPVLAIWGDRDAEVDWRKGVRVYTRAFSKAANEDATVRVLDAADHGLCAAAADGPEKPECRLADGYVETMLDWLRARGFAGAMSAAAERQTRAAQ